jgi:hypothetical protein
MQVLPCYYITSHQHVNTDILTALKGGFFIKKIYLGAARQGGKSKLFNRGTQLENCQNITIIAAYC